MGGSAIDGSKAADGGKREFLGSMAGTAKILGDIVAPVIDMDEIEACWIADYENDSDGRV